MIAVETQLTLTPAIVRFTRLAGRFTNFVPVMGGRVDVLSRALIRRQFQTLGRASGRGQWAALKPRTIVRRRFPEKPTLRQGDALYDALTKRGHPNQELVTTPDHYSLTIKEGATDSKGRSIRARFVGHQLGLPKKNLPVRQMIPDPLPKSFIADVRRAVKAYIVRGET